MDGYGQCAFLFRTDKQAIHCNRDLTIVPNQTWRHNRRLCGILPQFKRFKHMAWTSRSNPH